MNDLSEMVNGFQKTCLIVAALEVGLIDQLVAVPSPLAALADQMQLHGPSLDRLLHALKVLGLVEWHAEQWSLSPSGQRLSGQGLGTSLRAWTELIGGQYLSAWASLGHSLRTGQAAFPNVFGQTPWEHRQANPALHQSFQNLTRGPQALALSGLLRVYDFSQSGCVVDVGGGQGHLLAGLLQKCPHLRGILYDLPEVVAGAGPALAGLEQRCQIVGGSFLEQVPSGGDVYLLKHVLHNWDDSHCLQLLAQCRQAMTAQSRLLILENLLPAADQPANPSLTMLDIHMLAMHGGCERTESGYVALLEQTGLQLIRRLATRQGAPDLLEAGLPA